VKMQSSFIIFTSVLRVAHPAVSQSGITVIKVDAALVGLHSCRAALGIFCAEFKDVVYTAVRKNVINCR